MNLQIKPLDLLQGSLEISGLPGPRYDPFALDEYLAETEVHGLAFEVLRGRAAILFLLSGLAPYEQDNTGLMLFSGISELSWRTPPVDATEPSAHWTVLPGPMLSVVRAASAADSAQPKRTRPHAGAGPERVHSLRLVFHPSGGLTIAFQSAIYLVGYQKLADEEDPYVSMDSETEWHAASNWPK